MVHPHIPRHRQAEEGIGHVEPVKVVLQEIGYGSVYAHGLTAGAAAHRYADS
jgi:hypothetical protein